MTSAAAASPEQPPLAALSAKATRPPLATRPVVAAMAVLTVVLTALSNGYGFHRDELYFRMLEPAWGYIDQPPLTPLLARLFSAIADAPWAIRIPATAAVVASLFVIVQITRELGGGRAAQTLAAWGYASASFVLTFGHVLLTATLDLLVWPLVCLFIIRALRRNEPRWWLAAGVLVGLSMYNKLLIAMLLAAIAVGLLVVGPRRALIGRWTLIAAATALLIGAPNLIYQATHDWPQLTMGAALAENNAAEVRVLMWPFLLLLLGPPLVPIWIAGLVTLARRPAWQPVRAFAVAFPVLLILTFISGTQFYYPIGLMSVVFAAGCVPAAEWMARGRSRRTWTTVAVALNAVVSVTIALPVIPVGVLGDTPIAGINQIARDSVGWPAYVGQIAAVYDAVPAAERSTTVVITGNYGEAGAVDRYGPDLGLPPVYSGQNQLWFDARPPDTTITAVIVGPVAAASAYFRTCDEATRLANGLDVDNEEEGTPVAVCSGPLAQWDVIWPAFQHYD